MKSNRAILIPLYGLCAFLIGFLLRGAIPTPSQTSKPVADHAFVSGKYTVTKVLDGDTIEIEGGLRVRYADIDAPELHERFGTNAYEFNKQLVDRKTVQIELSEDAQDLYDRWLGYVYTKSGEFVNRKLVEEGYAKVLAFNKMKKPKYYDEFSQLEAEAKSSGRGMWVEEWIHRK